MTLLRIKTAIAYAARGKIVTSVWPDTAGINNNFSYTALSPKTPSMQPSNRKHYSSTALGFLTAENDEMRGMARAEVGARKRVYILGKLTSREIITNYQQKRPIETSP